MQPFIRPAPPGNTDPPPRGLTLTQFIQTVFVGLSGLDGTLVRPAWQKEPPKQPDIDVDWMGIGIKQGNPDANSFVGILRTNPTQTVSQRHEDLEITCGIYGPNNIENADLIRDGFSIPQNLQALTLANMGYMGIGPWRRVPDLVGERWIDRIEMSIFLRREIQRVYGIPTIVSATGIIYVPDVTPSYQLPWEVTP